MPYKHISRDERGDIEALLRAGKSPCDIARQIGVHRSTIYREIKRNGSLGANEVLRLQRANKPKIMAVDCRHYRTTDMCCRKHQAIKKYKKRRIRYSDVVSKKYYRNAANKRAVLRRSQANAKRTILQGCLLEAYVRHKLIDERWSPEQIAGRLKIQYQVSISPNTIYSYIYRGENKRELTLYLRHRGSRYRRRPGTLARRKAAKERLPSIYERPCAADLRCRLGDLEGDTIIGLDHKDRLLTHNDRSTGECRIRRIMKFDAPKIAQASLEAVASFGIPVHSITYDRGVEFAGYETIARGTSDGVFFAEAYSSWQRGSNENLNGLIRDYIPKRTDLNAITDAECLRIEKALNNRPRKRYNWLTPLEQRDKVGWKS